MEFDMENPLMNAGEDEAEIAALFEAESDHMSSPATAAGGIDLSVRRDTVSLILGAEFSCNLDPLIAYLAVNYADRFLSKQHIPREKPWIVRLLAIACLSLATKMKKTLFSLADFQREEGFIFDGETIQRMELVVLGGLQWRMRSITPFTFLNFFVSFFFDHSQSKSQLLPSIKSRAARAILKSQTEIKSLEFKPSVMAAASLISATAVISPAHLPAFRSALSSCEYLNKETLWDCCGMIADVVANDSWNATYEIVSSSDTPVTVLYHAVCPSYESDVTVAYISDDRDAKKRRLMNGCDREDFLQ